MILKLEERNFSLIQFISVAKLLLVTYKAELVRANAIALAVGEALTVFLLENYLLAGFNAADKNEMHFLHFQITQSKVVH
jgi:hypothetical protein